VSDGFLLQGPLPFNLRDATSSGKAAAAVAAQWVAVENAGAELADLASTAFEPGLYIIWATGDTPAVAGFWVCFGPEYTLDGPPGPPDREVPFVRELLNALTEAVWWQSLRVAPEDKGVWHPVVVLEWLPGLASRSTLAPPGQPVKRKAIQDDLADPSDPEEGGGGWLLPTATQMAAVQREDEESFAPETEEPEQVLPAARSLIAVVRGELRRGLTSHGGSYTLLDPPVLDGERVDHRVPLGTWLAAAAAVKKPPEPSTERAEHGPPLALAGERIGYPIYAWLTKALSPWPPLTAQVRTASLQPRDIGVKWLRQGRLAMGIIATVALIGVSVAMATSAFTRPVFKDSPPARELDPQPALSLCSADHEAFISELRCQISYAVHQPPSSNPVEGAVFDADRPSPVDKPICRDARSSVTNKMLSYLYEGLAVQNLQDEWCGLHDRDLDGFGPDGYDADWTQLVAARACFNVLGHPYTYTMARMVDGGSPDWPDPRPLLEPGNLQVKPLADLVTELNATCDSQRPNLERNVEGAILAAHIGSPPRDPEQESRTYNDAQRLQDAAVSVAKEGMRRDEARCFEAGRLEGVSDSSRYASLCKEMGALFTPVSGSDAWRELGGATEGRVDSEIVRGYVQARFPDPERGLPKLWRCHLELEGQLERDKPWFSTRWDLSAPRPRGYRVPAKMDAQVELDAAMLAIEDGKEPDACWTVIADRLNRYRPVHPLIEPLDPEIWPSTEQQLCGQMCAARYRGDRQADAQPWVTPGSDLGLCLRRDEPGEELGLDRLRIPWNYDADGEWRDPSAEDICAFNLIAQSRFSAGEAILPVAEAVPFDWAGEYEPTRSIAGGPKGLATRAAESLRSYGRARSVESCGHVASVCFGSGLLSVIGDASHERQDWSGEWTEWLSDLTRARPRDLNKTAPWCALIHPYLPRAGRLPEGQLDFPCAKGVDDARAQVELTLSALATGEPEGGAP